MGMALLICFFYSVVNKLLPENLDIIGTGWHGEKF
jgi:hypothetical protein